MKARPVWPGTTYLLTRRCAARILALRPDKDAKAITRYALFRAARLAKLQVHAALFSSNHFHLVVTDPAQNLPRFMQCMNSMIARAVNHLRGRQGQHFWAPGTYSRVSLLDAPAIWRRLVYTTANVVKDGLVSSPSRWPGFVLLPAHTGSKLRARRPQTDFFKSSSLPEFEDLTPTMPPLIADDLDLAAFKRAYKSKLDAFVAEVKLHRAGKPFMGPLEVKHQNPHASAGPIKGRSSTGSHFSVADDARKEQRARELAWLESYEGARGQWSTNKSVLFPDGTYKLHVFDGANLVSERSA